MLALTADSLFAHRGLHDESRPRNSLAAHVAAADAGYGIEFDIHLSQDGVPIVSHDPDTQHDTGAFRRIESTPAAAITELVYRGTDLHLITLDTLLEYVPPSVPLLVEIKPTRRIEAVVDAVARRLSQRSDAVALQSFQPSIVRAARHRHPQFLAGQLGEAPASSLPLTRRLHALSLATNALVRPQFLALEVSTLSGAAAVFWRRHLHCPLLAWTVTTPEQVWACRREAAGMIFEGFRP